jgi:hypothetical protein
MLSFGKSITKLLFKVELSMEKLVKSSGSEKILIERQKSSTSCRNKLTSLPKAVPQSFNG